MTNTTEKKIAPFSDALEGLFFELGINSMTWFTLKEEDGMTFSHVTNTRIVKITVPRRETVCDVDAVVANATIEITKLNGKHCRKGEHRASLFFFTQCGENIEGIELPQTITRKANQIFDAI